MYGHAPFFFNVCNSEIDSFKGSLVFVELNFGFGVLADSPVKIFNSVGGIDDFTDLHRIVKIRGQVIPVVFP